MRAGGVRLGADAEELGLDGVEVVLRVELSGEHAVERGGEAGAGCGAVERGVLGAVRYPNIRDSAGAEGFPEESADAAGGGTVGDPEIAHGGVGMGERAVGGERVREAGRVEIEAVQAAGLGPVHPRGEMPRLDGVAVHEFAGEVAVDGVEIQAMAAGQKLVDEIEVAAKLVEGAGLAGVVAGGLDATPRESGVGFFKAADIVALPAMQGNGCAREGGEGGLDIHAEGGVGGAGGAKGGG